MTDNLRAQLIAAAQDWDSRSSASESWMPGLIDALLPVVRHAQATALRDLANRLAGEDDEDARTDAALEGLDYTLRVLRDRADTLDTQP